MRGAARRRDGRAACVGRGVRGGGERAGVRRAGFLTCVQAFSHGGTGAAARRVQVERQEQRQGREEEKEGDDAGERWHRHHDDGGCRPYCRGRQGPQRSAYSLSEGVSRVEGRG